MTLLLSIQSILLSTVIAVVFGIYLAFSKRFGGLSTFAMLLVQAVPAFLVAVLIQGIFAYSLRMFPASGAYTPGITVGTNEYYINVLRHITLPFFTPLLCEIPGIFLITFYST